MTVEKISQLFLAFEKANLCNLRNLRNLRIILQTMSSPHILVVCTANICRSPVGEALLKARFQAENLADWTVSSAGTQAMTGFAASLFSRQLMAEQGLDIASHKSQPVTKSLLQQANLVVCMEMRHVKSLKSTFPAHKNRLFTLKQMVGKRGSVRDPYGGTRRDYERMVATVDRLIEQGFLRIKQLAEDNFQGSYLR